MLNKLKFNNLVISNKKGINRSRLQTVNKLVRKIRKLKSMLEKHPDNTKCKDRIRKSMETMELLKKLKSMDIMKQVLLMDKPASAVITNGLATPEELAVALLSTNKIMQSLINRFKTNLQLNETENNEWKQILMEPSKRRRKIERTEEKRRKRLDLKRQKAMESKRLEWLEENQHNVETQNTSFEKTATTGVWQIEEVLNDNNVKETENKVFVDENKNGKELNTIKRRCKISGKHQNNTYYEAENTSDCLVVDPFFVTDDGENYMCTAAIRNSNSVEQETNEKKDFHMIRLNKNFAQKSNINKRNSEPFSKNKKNYENNIRTRQKSFICIKSANDNHEKNLHLPAAKQNVKFEGKKITFADAEFNKLNDDREIDIKTQQSRNQIDKKGTLHPSWAAKQKLKPSITTFQGKKTIFENDE